jgi:acyl-CoA reductase-like NAD-dependent aldehyde dehydrogenase
MAMAATRNDEIKTLTTHYIDGTFVESHGREVIDTVKPTDGKVIALVTLADEEDTRRAIDAAKRAIVNAMRAVTVGDPADLKIAVGPMVSQKQYERVQSCIRKGIEEGAEVLGTDLARARRVASRLRTGRVVINGMTDDPQAPWGGFKYSGVEAFLETRAILEA